MNAVFLENYCGFRVSNFPISATLKIRAFQSSELDSGEDSTHSRFNFVFHQANRDVDILCSKIEILESIPVRTLRCPGPMIQELIWTSGPAKKKFSEFRGHVRASSPRSTPSGYRLLIPPIPLVIALNLGKPRTTQPILPDPEEWGLPEPSIVATKLRT